MSNAVLPKRMRLFTPEVLATRWVSKKYKIYLPPNYYVSDRRLSGAVFVSRARKRVVRSLSDHSRGGRAVHLADELIRSGAIGEMIIVGVSMTSDDGHVFGLGVNFLNPKAAAGHSGVGNGRFRGLFYRRFDSVYRQNLSHPNGTRISRCGRFSLGGLPVGDDGRNIPNYFVRSAVTMAATCSTIWTIRATIMAVRTIFVVSQRRYISHRRSANPAKVNMIPRSC